jgi:starch synthase
VKILHAAAELSPFVRTGGLGDAAGGLARALARQGHDVTVAVPAYADLSPFGLELPGSRDGSWVELDDDLLTVLARRDDGAFDRPGVYGPTPGSAYDDNWWRYGRFAVAVAELAADFDLVHLHDPHAGAAALLIDRPKVYTIHNAAHHLLGPYAEAAALLGVDDEQAAAMEWYGQANYLKAGIVASDRVTTVSHSHAAELGVEATSFGLAGVVASIEHPISGILNGIDAVLWDPAADDVLPAEFDTDDLSGRAKVRSALLDDTGLEDGMLFGNVGRIARQKGLDLLDPIIDHLVDRGMRLILIGNGELDVMVDAWVDRHPHRVIHLPYSEEWARLVSGGVDAYLMPSEFEPCGLGQIYAMRYGAPPVVHLTGGLADSVVDLDTDPEHATGFGYAEHTTVALEAAITRAMHVFGKDREVWRRMQHNGMAIDWSWAARSEEYLAVYAQAMADGP